MEDPIEMIYMLSKENMSREHVQAMISEIGELHRQLTRERQSDSRRDRLRAVRDGTVTEKVYASNSHRVIWVDSWQRFLTQICFCSDQTQDAKLAVDLKGFCSLMKVLYSTDASELSATEADRALQRTKVHLPCIRVL